jgi:sec-independent protein translocase protein TatA
MLNLEILNFLRLGWQELIIVLVIVIFIFGASRIKDIAKALGESVREFKKGVSEPVRKPEEEAIIEAAKKMGIKTEGKTIKQIADEIAEKTSAEKKEQN